jgi:hypothetical protein
MHVGSPTHFRSGTTLRLLAVVLGLGMLVATPAFAAWADRMKAPRLLERCEKAAGR